MGMILDAGGIQEQFWDHSAFLTDSLEVLILWQPL